MLYCWTGWILQDEPESSTPACWESVSRRKLRESLADRELSAVLRNDVEVTMGVWGGKDHWQVLLEEAAQEMLTHWKVTNRFLTSGINRNQNIKC